LNERTLLAITDIAKAFRGTPVLKGVDLELRSGEMLAVVGENGSGKSTLLKIIVGLLKPDAGAFRIRGTMGYCPQESLVFENLTVRENFRFFGKAYGLTDWRERSDRLLERFQFAQYTDYLISEVSGGTRQKLNLCLALMHDPDVLILDEPYSGFDWETYLHFWGLTKELLERGRGLLIVSHLIYDNDQFHGVHELVDGVLRCD
jgi:ABC-type multidrug transport system ATPase subunit